MSHTALLWALKQPVAKQGAIRDALQSGEEPPGLSTNESLILIRLADHHNGQTGRCHPGMRLLSDETGLALSTVQNAVTALRDFGLIEIDPTAAPQRRTRGAEKPVNGYRLRTDRQYGSVPLIGTVRDRPAVHNQESNLEVPAPTSLGTEPGTPVVSESDTGGFSRDEARLKGGLPGLVKRPAPGEPGQCEPPTTEGGSPSTPAPRPSVPDNSNTASVALALVNTLSTAGTHDNWRYDVCEMDNGKHHLVRTQVFGKRREVYREPLADDSPWSEVMFQWFITDGDQEFKERDDLPYPPGVTPFRKHA